MHTFEISTLQCFSHQKCISIYVSQLSMGEDSISVSYPNDANGFSSRKSSPQKVLFAIMRLDEFCVTLLSFSSLCMHKSMNFHTPCTN